jgi:dihydrolipoamide dehydrogenase
VRAEHEVDVAVLGGGPGGYATALRAAVRGLSVVIVEERALGGTCLHRGCVPSKALLHAGTIADSVRHANDLGFAAELGELALPKLHAFRDGVVARLHRGLTKLVEQRKIVTVFGRGTITEPGVLDVSRDGGEAARVRAANVVVATGSVPSSLDVAPVDGRRVLDSDRALALERVPERGIVIGGGAVGVEFASLWRSLGADVVVVEALERLVPLEDPDSSRALERALRRRGIEVRTGAGVGSVSTTESAARVEVGDDTFEGDTVLVAVGRRPNSSGIGLDALGVLDDRGFVQVDALGRASSAGLWAVGDVVPTLALAHAAYAEGFVVADAIAGLDPQPVDHAQVPRVTYSDPQVASVGLTEPEARAVHGEAVETTVESIAGNTRAVIEGATGQVKVVRARSGQVLGVHLVGPGVTELIAGASLATSWDAYVDEIAAIPHAHPTMSEVLREAMLTASGVPFHAAR